MSEPINATAAVPTTPCACSAIPTQPNPAPAIQPQPQTNPTPSPTMPKLNKRGARKRS